MRTVVAAAVFVVLGACATAPAAARSARPRFSRPEELLVLPPDSLAPRPIVPVRPRYPDAERARGVGATPVVALVIDTTGSVEYPTISFLRTAPLPFVRSVCDALRLSSFAPAVVRGQLRRALVVMAFGFEVMRDGPAQLGELEPPTTRGLLATESLDKILERLERAPHCP